MTAAIRQVAVVTGTRAEFGLLRTVMRAVEAHPQLQLQVIVAGAHLLPPDETWKEVAAEFDIAARVAMQRAGESSRLHDAAAFGRGAEAFANVFMSLRPDWVVVLGDRIEVFAAASAAGIGGVAVAHLHGGDRAEGVADESMRHAVTKLAHLHLPATPQSAERIVRMGEDPSRVHIVGSPAIDELASIPLLDDDEWRALGQPQVILMHHPIGASFDSEYDAMRAVIQGCAGRRTLALHPNHDPGRDGVLKALLEAEAAGALMRVVSHLPRVRFVGALKRLASSGGVLVGNSSAGLIEAAALRVPVVDIGPRQAGRERAGNVVHADVLTPDTVSAAISEAQSLDLSALAHPYGDGRAGQRAADALASIDPRAAGFTRKRNAY